MKGKISIAIALVLLITTAFCLFACDKDESVAVDYSAENSFFVKTTDSDSALVFEPVQDPVYGDDGMTYTKVNYRYGVVFYVGTAIEPKYYEYLGTALAKQGYLVVMPKFKLNMAYNYHAEQEKAFSDYPNVKFFIAGHSQGGGAAIRRASENASSVAGAILLSPLAYRHKKFDENGKPVKDENDVEIYISDNLKDVDVPTLLIEAAEDHVLTDEMKADARSRLKEGYTHKVISPGAHMSFCTADSDDVLKVFNDDGEGISESDKQAQRTQTVAYVLEFVKNLSK